MDTNLKIPGPVLSAKWLLLAGLAVLTAVTLAYIQDGYAQETSQVATVKDIYYCPMHPDYTSDRPGSCPICGMDLVLRKKATTAPAETVTPVAPAGAARKVLFYRNPMDPSITSPVAMKDQMGMDYVPVYEDTSAGPAAGSVTVEPDRQRLIDLKKDTVRQQRLAVPILTTGKVAYDPELYVAQETYLQAVRTAGGSASSDGFLAALKQRLVLAGMSEEEIAALRDHGTPQEGLYLPSASGKAWVYLTLYAADLGLVRPGQAVTVDTEVFPGEVFKGQVSGVTPVLDAATRSARARAQVEDPKGRLRPEMFVNARLEVDLGDKLAVPAGAVMDTGLRKVVYIVRGNTFTPREVALGVKAGDLYEVLGGLAAGEEVVTGGNFLIDSESRMKGTR